MTDLRKAAEMALEALQESKPIDPHDEHAFNRSALAIEALRQALTQGEQEPVAWMDNDGNFCDWECPGFPIPLYTTKGISK